MKPELLPILVAIVLAGCQSVETFNQETPPEYMTATRADFFARGPAQSTPPEKIEKDTFVKVLKKDSGYAVVKLLDGRTGYIPYFELKPAPPEAPEVPFDPAIVEDIIEVPLPDFAEIPDEVPEKLRKR
ncbi:MAG: hypothetical protein NTW41_11055 [Verrucomicrobia bacterium]|nr:hypothetical protein [Verrucomicrobiota bacterium]